MTPRQRLAAKIGAGVVALAVPLVAHFEGTVYRTYRDPIGIITSCTGHTGPELRMGQTFTKEETENETRGEWYIRQMLGSANIEGGNLFHIMSGNLSHQIEHHLFPDVPANRYAEMAPVVRDICRRYGVHYNTGSMVGQFSQVIWRILRHSFPSSPAPMKPSLQAR